MLDKALNQPEQNPEQWNNTGIHVQDIMAGIPLSACIDKLCEELQKDKQPGSYYHTWQCNIAMCFYDAYRHRLPMDAEHANTMHLISDIANQAAIRFIELLCQQTNSNIGMRKQSELQTSQSIQPKQ